MERRTVNVNKKGPEKKAFQLKQKSVALFSFYIFFFRGELLRGRDAFALDCTVAPIFK